MKQAFNNEIMLFSRGNTCFGVEVDHVVRIEQIPAYGVNQLPIPCKVMYGLINIEGMIIPVSRVPYLPPRKNPNSEKYNILVLENKLGKVFSIGVDKFEEIIQESTIEMKKVDHKKYSVYCYGTMKQKDKDVWIINVDRMYEETIKYARKG